MKQKNTDTKTTRINHNASDLKDGGMCCGTGLLTAYIVRNDNTHYRIGIIVQEHVRLEFQLFLASYDNCHRIIHHF